MALAPGTVQNIPDCLRRQLKTLKRQMYGRAGFELLRARLLPMARGSPLHRN
jgi:hypothetical protein